MGMGCPLCGEWNERDEFLGNHSIRCDKILGDTDIELER